MGGPFRCGRDKHLRASDQLVATGVVFAKPRLVVAEPVQRNDALHVVLQRHGRGLTGRMEWRDENAKTQRCLHRNSNPVRNSSRAAVTSPGRSCCSQ
ncbi:Uncharacterised protein [Mycobacterium tuberculosis]|nr:Uncharacterised protein [Mycobacterium tuberculosis]